MHRLEPACNHIRIGAEARALAPQLDPHLTVANAINEAAGDDLAADGQRVEGHGLALFGRLNHCEVRHFLNNARDQRCLVPCDQGLATMLDNKLIAALGQAITDADGRLVALGFDLGGLEALAFARENGQLARPIMHLRLGRNLSKIRARLIANDTADHQLFEQLAHGSGALARDNVRLAGDGGEAGGEVLETVNHLNNSLV